MCDRCGGRVGKLLGIREGRCSTRQRSGEAAAQLAPLATRLQPTVSPERLSNLLIITVYGKKLYM